MKDAFPFSAVVGQDEARLALLLAAVDPAIGGVLLRGEKGSAKSTLARGLAGLLPGGAPFVELPVGATEDRVLGSLDLRAALEGAGEQFRPGLLAAAHGGVLYVDEVNLLPDHLVDALLDAAASGVHRVERDGVSHEHPARFVLLGSMNPEEGELRPQLLDRFGLAVEVATPRDPVLRAEAVRRRLAHDAGAPVAAAAAGDEELRWRLAAARSSELPDEIVSFAARLAVSVGAESLRADLVLCRAAAALAGWEGRVAADEDDVARVAPLALAHRRRRRPFDPPSLSPEELASALDDAHSSSSSASSDDDPPSPPEGSDGADSGSGSGSGSGSDDSGGGPADAPENSPSWRDLAGDALSRPPDEGLGLDPNRRPMVEGRGRTVGHQLPASDDPQGVAVLATVRSALHRRLSDPDGPALTYDDLREPRRAEPQSRTVVLCVDTSGSMGTSARVDAATGAVLSLLADAYLQRDEVALVAFRDRDAAEVLPPTGSVELARARLADLPTGGPTPLAEGIATALAIAHRSSARGALPLLVLLTDGRATGAPDALTRAHDAARSVAAAGIESVILDAEPPGRTALGLAAELATSMNARHVPLPQVTPRSIDSIVRQSLTR